ncbi:unnamed protein product [Lactuca saligna]|uniref:Uncharacterized protein n=1 Tax=Lactuca saligna TaxID=75948 RepID=A0AA36A116_LACSI|nr:unnamed protein product [Lactuca saligna]
MLKRTKGKGLMKTRFNGFIASRLMLKRTKGKGLMKTRFSLKTVTNDKSMPWNLKLSVLEYGDLAGDVFLNLWIPLDRFVGYENVLAGMKHGKSFKGQQDFDAGKSRTKG